MRLPLLWSSNPSFHTEHPFSSPLYSYWFIATNCFWNRNFDWLLFSCFFLDPSLNPFPLSFSINGYVFVSTCFMPLKKVRFGSKAKAIYPIYYMLLMDIWFLGNMRGCRLGNMLRPLKTIFAWVKYLWESLFGITGTPWRNCSTTTVWKIAWLTYNHVSED